MSTSIFEKRWLDLVFEGKNKAYGAYQLRLENPRTTMLALLYALLFIGGSVGGGMLLSSFGNKPKTDFLPPPMSDSLTVVEVDLDDPIEKPEAPKPETETPPSSATDPVEDWRTDPVVAPPNDTTTEPTDVPPSTNTGTDTGTAPGTGNTTEGTPNGGDARENPGGDMTITTPPMLDRQPAFPGGMAAFYTYVGNNFDKPDLDEAKTVRIFVSFVIEKDGSMTDIEVKNKPGYALEKEAVRVLKSLRKKWTPGIRNGQPVRVLYTLPIVVKPE